MERAELSRLLAASGVTALAPSEVATRAIVISSEQPGEFMAGFARAVVEGGDIFLVDPAWGESQRSALTRLLTAAETTAGAEGKARRGWLMIPSGGTSGELKFARHDGETIAAAVRGFCAHFGITRVNAVGLLPLHHVSGLMAWMRCVMTGGTYVPWNWPEMKDGRRPELADGSDWVLSLVPTQLQRLLEVPDAVAWLRRFKVIFIGGGPVWPELAEAAAAAGLPISLSYGMTETAAMATALRPGEFIAGQRSSGAALAHATVTITAEGVVRIEGESVFRGYFPHWRDAREYQTEDLGRIDERGGLQVLGRRDAMIITGGKKVQPVEVEAALRATGLFTDVAVIGVPDAAWGEAVVACYPATDESGPAGLAAVAENTALLAYQRPKRYVPIAVKDWPRNAQGKLNRAALRSLAMEFLSRHQTN
jgi:O-succinylbenzoic acid--CoA ligase